MDAKKGIPENSSIVMPRLFCRDAAAEMEFCSHTFGALELNRRPGPDGKVVHGLMAISGEMIMIEAEWPGFPARAAARWQLAGWNLRLRRRCGSSRGAGSQLRRKDSVPSSEPVLGRPNGMDHGPTGTHVDSCFTY